MPRSCLWSCEIVTRIAQFRFRPETNKVEGYAQFSKITNRTFSTKKNKAVYLMVRHYVVLEVQMLQIKKNRFSILSMYWLKYKKFKL